MSVDLLQTTVKYLRFNEAHLEILLSDIPDESLTVCPAKGLENHPAWTTGHLCDAAGMTCEMLGGKSKFPEEWIEIYRRKGPGDPKTPSTSQSDYPAIKEVFQLYVSHHDEAIRLLKNAPKELLEQKDDEWAFGSSFSSVLEIAHFMACWHETHHISQLSSWRRAMGLPSKLRPLAIQLKSKE